MTRLKKDKIYKTHFIGIRCTEEQHNEIKLKANLYTEGNMSEFTLYSALNFEPNYEDLESPELDDMIKKQANYKGISRI